jgi:hypothetical protein
LKQDLLEIKKFEIKYSCEDLMRETTFLIETSSDSKCILNQKSGKFRWVEIQWKFTGKT